jgi:choline dehydrogenase-like flavoprotein
MSAFISFEAPSGSSFLALRYGYNLLRRGKFGRELARDIWRCLLHPAAIVSPIYNLYVRRRSYVPSATARLVIMSEQEPDADSRITLSADLDALGMPRSEIHWQPTPLVGQSVAIFARALVEEFKRLGLADVELDEWVEAGEWRSNMVDNFHHMGTTRMSAEPAQGVVDPDCRTHQVRNLFIGGSAVFPTGGHSNPTLTLIALCLRLADKLKSELL